MPELILETVFKRLCLGDYKLKRPTGTPGLCLCGHLADCLLFLTHASRSVCHCSYLCIYQEANGQSTISKPKNARSKRALEARQPKEVEDPRTVIFVRGTHTGEVVNGVMKDLVGGPLSLMILSH